MDDLEKLKCVSEKLEILVKVEKFFEGYEIFLGKKFNGIELFGGEW